MDGGLDPPLFDRGEGSAVGAGVPLADVRSHSTEPGGFAPPANFGAGPNATPNCAALSVTAKGTSWQCWPTATDVSGGSRRSAIEARALLTSPPKSQASMACRITRSVP